MIRIEHPPKLLFPFPIVFRDLSPQHSACHAVAHQSEGGSSVLSFKPDGTRCDCLSDTHAIEFDFGSNWAEAIGQSAYYGLQTGKKAGIVLVLETVKDRKYWIRLNTTIEHFGLPIDTWNVGDAAY